MHYEMPEIDVEKVVTDSEQERAILARILNKGALKASKPAIRKGTENEYTDRCATYVWRMTAFLVSQNPVHQCMPVCADFDLPGKYDERRALSKQLDELVDRIVDSIPPSQWHGVRRWGQAFGMVGTPRYNEEGAVIYR